MKARVIGIIVVVLGLLLVLTPWFIFPVCGMGRYAPESGQIIGHHGCHATLRAEIALGMFSIVAGMIPVLWPMRKILLAASVAALIIAVLAILFPTAITGMCGVPTMPCRLGTTPALVTVGILMIFTSGAGIFMSRKLP